MPTPRRTAALLALALAALLGTACGDDDTPDSSPVSDAAADTDPGPGSSPDDGGDDPLGITDAGDALDSIGLEAKASAIESAMGEDRVDRVEVEGDTIHVHLKGGSFDPMMGCIVTGGVLSEGEKAVMHLDGEAIPCD